MPMLKKFSSTNRPISGESGSLTCLLSIAAVASEAAGAAVGGLGKEEPCAAPLAAGQRTVIPGDEPIERRVPGDHRCA